MINIFSNIKRYWKFQKVEHIFCAAFPSDDPMMTKSFARGLGIATQLFAVATAFCALVYFVNIEDITSTTFSDWFGVVKMTLIVYGMVLITPRVLLMIPAIIKMYAFKPKRFYIVMTGVSLIALSVFIKTF